jgi:hypothetical protein
MAGDSALGSSLEHMMGLGLGTGIIGKLARVLDCSLHGSVTFAAEGRL